MSEHSRRYLDEAERLGRELIGSTGTTTCVCPTTAGDLGTGIAPVRALVQAGSPLALGSDQHAVVDLLAEARMLEMAERLRTQTRGVFDMPTLVTALTRRGYLALGWDGGRLRAGSAADFFSIRLDTVRTAGCLPDQAVMAASAPDVDTVVNSINSASGSPVHTNGFVGFSTGRLSQIALRRPHFLSDEQPQ